MITPLVRSAYHPFCAQTSFMIMYLMYAGRLCHTHVTSSRFFVVFIFSWIGWPLRFRFFRACIWFSFLLLVYFTSVVHVAAATLRLHISTWSAQIWSSCSLDCVDRSPVVVVSLVNAASCAAFTNAKFMKVSSISPRFQFLELLQPADTSVSSSFSLSRYYDCEFSLKRTHVCSLAAMLFHIQCSCVYYCVANVWVMPLSAKCRFVKRRIPRDCKFLAHLHLVKQYFYCLFDVICCLHFVSILHQVFRSY